MLTKVAHNQHCVRVTNRTTGAYGISVCDPNTVITSTENWDNPELFGEDPIIENVAFNGDQVLELSDNVEDQTVDASVSAQIILCTGSYVGTTYSPTKPR